MENGYVFPLGGNGGGSGGSSITVDQSTNSNSTNPVSNKAITTLVNRNYASVNAGLDDLSDAIDEKADYETGTFTAIIEKTSTAYPGYEVLDSMEVADCRYTRIGNICYAHVPLDSRSFSTSSDGYIHFGGGLPFTPKGGRNQIGQAGFGNTPKGTTELLVQFGQSYCTAWQFETSQGCDTNAMFDMTVIYEIKE